MVGTATYNASRYLSRILAPLVGNSKHTVANSKEFIEVISDEMVGQDRRLLQSSSK